MKSTTLGYHEFVANLLFDEDGLSPFFAADSRVKDGDGSQVAEFETDGETWVAKLYFQESGLVHPGLTTPQGTEWRLEEMREFRIAVFRHPDEDPVALEGGEVQQKFNAHIAPRWHGMESENDEGKRSEIPVPDGFAEGVNVKVSGSNIDFSRYHDLLQLAANAVGISARYFASPHPYSNIVDAERYVRVHRDASGPVHARDGPIASMNYLLENDRSGYRKLVQNDDDIHGRNLPGYYHTVTLGPSRVREAFDTHRLPKEVKHYYAREAKSKNSEDALAHPKVGASYQVSRWDETLRFDDLETLNEELSQTVLSVLLEAGLEISPVNGPGPFVTCDAYWQPDLTDENPDPVSLDLTHIRHEQESVVVRHLADGGFSPVEWSTIEHLVADGGSVSPKEIAEDGGHHIDSVYRALERLEEMVDRKYGEVALKSDYVAELVHDAVKEAKESTRRAVATAAKSMEAARRGKSRAMEKFVAWTARYGVDVSNRMDALEVDLGELDPDADASPKMLVQKALQMWTDANQDPARFRMGTVRYSRPEDRGSRSVAAHQLLR